MKLFSISSGSKGNCLFIKANKTSILVDAGVSYSLIEKGLLNNGENIFNVSAVLITHEHSDHTKGLAVLVKKCPQIKIYAHYSVCEILKRTMPIIESNLVEILSPVFYVEDFLVSAFKVPHDSRVCLNYSIFEEDKKFSIITDCGTVVPRIVEEIKDSNLIFIESNHNIDMLKANKDYSSNLKARILSEHGHLSNNAAANIISKIMVDNPKCRFVLCHLSSNNNTYELAIKEVSSIVKEQIGILPELEVAKELVKSDIFEI